MAVSLWLANGFLQREAEDRIRSESELIAETASATRQYTEEQVKPLLMRLQKRESTFLPQTVPTYSALQVFDYLHKSNPEYIYKDAMVNPTNPADRATSWEVDIINEFRSNPDLHTVARERRSSAGGSFFFAQPIIISDSQKACLACHSTPSRAPAAMIRQYGPDNGFGWTTNNILGVQIISVPKSVPIEMAHNALKTLFLFLGLGAILMLCTLDVLLLFTVIRPVAKMSRLADEISQGRLGEDLPVKGKDEISVLAESFNRMQRSVARMLKMLSHDTES